MERRPGAGRRVERFLLLAQWQQPVQGVGGGGESRCVRWPIRCDGADRLLGLRLDGTRRVRGGACLAAALVWKQALMGHGRFPTTAAETRHLPRHPPPSSDQAEQPTLRHVRRARARCSRLQTTESICATDAAHL